MTGEEEGGVAPVCSHAHTEMSLDRRRRRSRNARRRNVQ